MNNFTILKAIIVFSSLSYLSVYFLRNYNSPKNIEKRCILKFEKVFFLLDYQVNHWYYWRGKKATKKIYFY